MIVGYMHACMHVADVYIHLAKENMGRGGGKRSGGRGRNGQWACKRYICM